MSKKKVPELRFKGFTEDWEQRKVQSISKKTYGGGTPKTQIAEYWQGTFPWIQSSDLKINELKNVKPQKFITEEAVKNSAAKVVPENSIAIVTRVGVGKLAYLKYSYSTSQDFLSLSELTVDPLLGVYGLYRLIKKELNSIQGTSIKGMTKSDLLNKKLYIPVTVNEQIKIGKFFKKLDGTIALHQRKLEKLELLRQGFTQYIFPKRGDKSPQFRFTHFHLDWKQCKLGDFLKIPKKEKIKVTDVSQLMTVKLNLEGVYSGSNRETLSFGSTTYYKRHSGQFIYGKQNFFNGSMAIISEDLEGKATSGDVPALDIINIDVNYLFSYISRPIYWKSKEAYSSGTGSKRIHEQTLQSFEISVPSLEEQVKIGSLLKELDNKILLYKEKIKVLDNFKKAFLQKMFI